MLYTAWGSVEHFNDSQSVFQKSLNQQNNEYEKEKKPDNSDIKLFIPDVYPKGYVEIHNMIGLLEPSLLPEVDKTTNDLTVFQLDQHRSIIYRYFISFIEKFSAWISSLLSVILIIVQRNIDYKFQKLNRIDPPEDYLDRIYKMSDLLYNYGIDSKIAIQGMTLAMADPPLDPKDLALYQSMLNRARLAFLEFENYPTRRNYFSLIQKLQLIVQTMNTLPEKLRVKIALDGFVKFWSDKSIRDALVHDLDLSIYKKPRIN